MNGLRFENKKRQIFTPKLRDESIRVIVNSFMKIYDLATPRLSNYVGIYDAKIFKNLVYDT